MHTRWLIVNVLFCFFDFLGTPSISIYPPCHWVVQMPGREKSSKWKYKEDEGGKKDAEKEKTRSREQEWSMNHIMNEWSFHCGVVVSECFFPKFDSMLLLLFILLWLVTAVLFRSTSPTTSKTSGEQEDAKASSRDRDEGTSQPSPRSESKENVTSYKHKPIRSCCSDLYSY